MKPEKVQKTCPCGMSFDVYRSQYQNYIYCNKACSSKTHAAYFEVICENCRVPFTRPACYGPVGFCSDVCRRGVTDPGYYSKKRRAAMRRGDKIDRLAVFDFFGWVCNICGDDIDQSLRFPNERAATLDHIIPLSKGGRHVWENVAPAHACCNASKGDDLQDTAP